MAVRPAKTQMSLGIRPVWSESSLSAWRKLGSLATHWAHSEDSDQTGRMPRLILVFAGRTLILLVLSCHGSNLFIFQHHLWNHHLSVPGTDDYSRQTWLENRIHTVDYATVSCLQILEYVSLPFLFSFILFSKFYNIYIWAATWQNQQVSVRPAKTHISLGIRPVWSESSLSTWTNIGSIATHWAHSEDSDQTRRMPRLIWVFAGRTLILLVLSCHGLFINPECTYSPTWCIWFWSHINLDIKCILCHDKVYQRSFLLAMSYWKHVLHVSSHYETLSHLYFNI